MKNKIKKHLTIKQQSQIKFIISLVILPLNYIYDLKRYAKYNSSRSHQKDKNKLEGLILKEYHRIEKGLALKQPRPGFGQDTANKLCNLMHQYILKFGEHTILYQALSSLEEYIEFNQATNSPIKEIEINFAKLKATLKAAEPEKAGGTITLESAPENCYETFKKLCYSRHSIRSFTGNKVETATIIKAIEAAIKTPSVCNRQTARVYIIESEALKSKALALQNGNRGFGSNASHIVIVTSDIKFFEGASERNQPYFDSGLFAMSLVYAFHSLNIGTCFLNWSANFSQDKKLHAEIGIPENEIIGTLIAIGEAEYPIKIAQSSRRSIEEYYKLI